MAPGEVPNNTYTYTYILSHKLSEEETERSTQSEWMNERATWQSDPFAVGKRIRMHRVAEQMSYSHRQREENTRTQAHGAAAIESVSQSEGGKKSDTKKLLKNNGD